MKRQNIQVLRVLACFGILAVHIGQRLELQGHVMNIAYFGAMGVYLFFMISGYVCWLSFSKVNGEKLKLSKYYIGRFARILPVYYTVILFQFILHSYILNDVPVDETHIGWFRYVFFINEVIPVDNGFWTNLGAVWTISAFMLFYLIAPFLYRYIRGYNTALIAWLISYFLYFVWNRRLPDSYNPVKFMMFFLFGIVIYYIEAEKKEMQLLIFYIINLLTIAIHLIHWEVHTWTMLFGLIILVTRDLVIHNNLLSRCIDILDEYSYSIYLVHPLVVEHIDVWKLTHTSNWKIQAVMIIIVETVAGVILVHNIIEKPLYRFIMKNVGKKEKESR